MTATINANENKKNPISRIFYFMSNKVLVFLVIILVFLASCSGGNSGGNSVDNSVDNCGCSDSDLVALQKSMSCSEEMARDWCCSH